MERGSRDIESGLQTRTVAMKNIGSIELFDLELICRFYGHEGLPHPFMPFRCPVFASQQAWEDRANDVPDRFKSGDLQIFRQWFTTLLDADIYVECTEYSKGCELKIVAHRMGDLGFFAQQQQGADAVDVFTLSPYDLGPAIAARSVLSQPGRHSKITVTEYPGWSPDSTADADAFSVLERASVANAPQVSYHAAASVARVQSRCKPARQWGFDDDKDSVLWLTTEKDGDYIAASDRSYWTPMTRQILATRIDKLIAGDIRTVREIRGL